MAEKDKRYYWLKLKRDFFKRHDIQIIESMPNGKDYILFYLKLLCESVDHDGNLRFNEQIPYSEQMLSTITNTNIDIVRSAIKVFTELQMMELLDDGTFFMNEVNKMIGSAVDNDNANRQRRFRERQKQLALQENYADVTNNNESKSIEKELDIDKDIISSNSNELDCQTQDVRRALETWNELGAYGIKTVGKLKNGTQRYQMLQARIREYGIDDVLTAISNVSSSDFLQGKHGGKPWQITFDWFVRPNNFPKVLDGNYNNDTGGIGNGRVGTNDTTNERDSYADEFERMLEE